MGKLFEMNTEGCRGEQDAIDLALLRARESKDRGSYAVGAVLINNEDGTIYASAGNHAVEGDRVVDPTAHPGVLLADLVAKGMKGLPAADKLTIISTLDPSPLSYGAARAVGLHVKCIASNSHYAIGHNCGNVFGVPSDMRDDVFETVSYFTRDEMGDCVRQEARALFLNSVDHTRQVIIGDADENVAINGQYCGASSEAHGVLAELNPKGFHLIRYQEEGEAGIAHALRDEAVAAYNRCGRLDAVAAIDPFGHILALRVDETGIKTQPAMRTLMQDYARARAGARNEARAVLPHPKFLRFASLFGLSRSAHGLMSVGALTCSIGCAPVIGNGRPFGYYLQMGQTEGEVAELMAHLPPSSRWLAEVSPKALMDEEFSVGLQSGLRRLERGRNADQDLFSLYTPEALACNVAPRFKH